MTDADDTMSFRDALTSDRFVYGAEVVTTRGLIASDASNNVLAHARAFLDDPRFAWISVTDSPGGGPMLPPDWVTGFLPEDRARVVIHLTCKDMNRNGLESAAWRYASEGCHNILALTGDYPTAGFRGTPDPSFDLESVGLVSLLSAMNRGLQVTGRRGKIETLAPTDFFIGCAASPFKKHERELMPQYFKLLRKIQEGAHWIVPQLGYDMRKFNEIKLLLDARGLNVPVIGNVYLLTRVVARMFNSGQLAGCVVSDAFLEKIEKAAAGPDKGRAFFREFAAKQLAVFKGLGFAAGYVGGIAKPETFSQIVETAESFGEDDWREFIKEMQFSQPDEFFLYEHDPETGLSDPSRVNPDYLASLENPKKPKEVGLGYRLSRRVHALAFTVNRGLYGTLKKIYARWDKKPGWLSRMAYGLEKRSKSLLYGCKDCGDCSLPDLAYLCPNHACSKGSRNGPCGGSSNGRCELDDKECVWARAYERLKYYGESETMLQKPITFYDASLMNTSSWANFFLDRDHAAAISPDGKGAEKGPKDQPDKKTDKVSPPNDKQEGGTAHGN